MIGDPTQREVEAILAEMDRFGPNRGWVLAGAIGRARRDEPVAWPSFFAALRDREHRASRAPEA